MIELLRSNDPVLVSFARSLLQDAGIAHQVADSHMAVIDGSIDPVQVRILVASEEHETAHRLLVDAGALG